MNARKKIFRLDAARPSFVVTASAILFCMPCSSNAQSSVTLSGIIDTGLLYTNNSGGHAAWQSTSGQLTQSRLILSGSEDLGGGTHAVLRLMDPFLVPSGRGNGRAFNVAYVGLANDHFGTVTAGRQWDSTIDMAAAFASNETWAGYIGSHVGDADNTNSSFKISNAIKYTSTNLAGFRFGATYGFSNQASSDSDGSGFANNRVISAGAAYARGPFSAGVGLLQADRPDSQAAGALGSPATGVVDDYANVFSTSPNGNAGVLRLRICLAGASYRVGGLLFGGLYTKVQYRYLDASALTLNNYEANLTWQITPAWQTGVAYVRTDGSESGAVKHATDPAWDQINLGTEYALSKRTTLYLIGVVQQGHHADAQIYKIASSSSRRQVAITSGIQHTF